MGAGENVNDREIKRHSAGMCGSGRARFLALIAMLFGVLAVQAISAGATDKSGEFDRANKLYEQGKFPEAVAAYESLAASGVTDANLWFNLGNAAYKSGQMGRAVAAYRMAERLKPRDPSLRANLQFVRGKIYSNERVRLPFWKALIRIATVNEWTALTAMSFWALFSMLACGEVTRRRYPKTAFTLFGTLLASGVALFAAIRDQRSASEAVVIAREVTARFGPLDESQPAFQLRDGAEVTMLDAKGDWLQVRDAEKRTGWMRREEAIVLPASFSAAKVAHQRATP
jgi:tetratricopeptide (TPR) repeat protein